MVDMTIQVMSNFKGYLNTKVKYSVNFRVKNWRHAQPNHSHIGFKAFSKKEPEHTIYMSHKIDNSV